MVDGESRNHTTESDLIHASHPFILSQPVAG